MSMQEAGKRILDKGLSGRFLAINAIVFTYCLIMWYTVRLVTLKIVQWEMFLAIFTPFALLAKDIVQAYFQKEERSDIKEVTVTSTESKGV